MPALAVGTLDDPAPCSLVVCPSFAEGGPLKRPGNIGTHNPLCGLGVLDEGGKSGVSPPNGFRTLGRRPLPLRFLSFSFSLSVPSSSSPLCPSAARLANPDELAWLGDELLILGASSKSSPPSSSSVALLPGEQLIRSTSGLGWCATANLSPLAKRSSKDDWRVGEACSDGGLVHLDRRGAICGGGVILSDLQGIGRGAELGMNGAARAFGTEPVDITSCGFCCGGCNCWAGGWVVGCESGCCCRCAGVGNMMGVPLGCEIDIGVDRVVVMVVPSLPD